MPKVSVIIPNYNHYKFIEQRISTVLNQTFKDFDLLILDDCSTDNSMKIIESYKNYPKVKILLNTTNSGNTFRQWAKGINNTEGEYIWIAESDDYSEPTFLESMVNLLNKHTEASIAFCGNKIVDENSVLLYEHRRKNLGNDIRIQTDTYLINGKLECKNNLITNNTIANVSSCVFRRSESHYIVNSLNYKLCGDWLFYINIALKSNLIYLDKTLNFFRNSNSSVRNKGLKEGILFKEKLKIFLYLNHIFKFNKIFCKKYAKEISTTFLPHLFTPGVSFRIKDVIVILVNLHKVYSFAFLFLLHDLGHLLKKSKIAKLKI